MKSANPIRWLFGHGIGAKEERIGSGSLVYALARVSTYYINSLTNGAILLNFGYTTVKGMGIVGLLIYSAMYFKMIPRASSETGDRRVGCLLYVVLYVLMLLYRMACTNGLVELYMFTLVESHIFVWEVLLRVVFLNITSLEYELTKGNRNNYVIIGALEEGALEGDTA